jgi:hypothetical protein
MDGVFRARIDAKPAQTDELAPADLEAVEWAVTALRAMAGLVSVYHSMTSMWPLRSELGNQEAY